MFSLKPPRPTFRSYLLPPPQVNNPLLGASGEAPRVPGSPAAGLPEPQRRETHLLGSPHWLGGNLGNFSAAILCPETCAP